MVRNSNHVGLVLPYCTIIFGFMFVNCLKFLQIKNEILNQTLNDSYIYRKGLKDIFKKM